MIAKDGSRLIYRFDAETLVVEGWGKNGLRVRSSKMPEMPQNDWALIEPKTKGAPKVEVGDGRGSITNGKITARVDSYGVLVISNDRGEVLLEEYVRNRQGFDIAPGKENEPRRGFASALEVEAREFRPILGGDYSLSMRFESDLEEKIFGMGQYQQPYLNVKGCSLELAQRNSQASVPFAVSSLGYGFLWNNPAVGSVNFARNLTTWYAESTQLLDYWVTAGDTPAEILENYANVTGTVPMMPDWAMGFWQCKLRYQTQEELLGVAREYKKRGIPLDVIVVDFFHWTMQGEWKFDPEYWPDPKAMVDELREMGVELMVSVWPTVDHRSENYDEMREKGYLVRTDRGHRIAMDFHGNTIHVDTTNPGARKYLWEKARENYYKYGIRIFWLDEAEPEYTYYHFDLYRYHLGPNVQIGNIYPLNYAQAFYEGMEQEGQKNIINLLRCAWAGSQRYGALVWSGDIDSSFASMRNQLTAGLNMGMAGIPWWTTDIGGFHGGNPDDEAFRECFTRWFQWGTFCPVMRLHGDRDPQGKPLSDKATGGGVCVSGAPNEVWSYGEDVYAICKDYINIRERIKPYTSRLMEAAHQTGAPVMRALFYEFPGDAAAWQVEDAYMFGPDVLVAPILYAGQRTRKVYLPAGSRWENAWTGEVLQGGQTVEVAAPIAQIPLFVREGGFHPLKVEG